MTGFVIGVIIVLGVVGIFWIVKFALAKRKSKKDNSKNLNNK